MPLSWIEPFWAASSTVCIPLNVNVVSPAGVEVIPRTLTSPRFGTPPLASVTLGFPERVKFANLKTAIGTLPVDVSTNRASKLLLEIAPQYFTPENRPEGTTESQWEQARSELESRVKSAAIALVLKPGIAAQAAKDCPAQESAFSKAFFDHPDSGLVAYHLGSALIACESGDPEKLARGLWFVGRAAVLDPARSGIAPNDLPAIDAYLKKIYVEIHGSEQGLDRLKRQASASPAPPPGFRIPSEAEIVQEQQAELERNNPQLASWVKMKRMLSEANGEQYFSGQLKNTAVPQLWGKLVEARPACRPRELQVAVPLPDAPSPQAEIALRLDKALAGQPEAGSELRFDAVPSSFSSKPFFLTMATSPERIQGLKSAPCAPATAGNGAKDSSASRKK